MKLTSMEDVKSHKLHAYCTSWYFVLSLILLQATRSWDHTSCEDRVCHEEKETPEISRDVFFFKRCQLNGAGVPGVLYKSFSTGSSEMLQHPFSYVVPIQLQDLCPKDWYGFIMISHL